VKLPRLLCSIDPASSRIKTHGLPIYLPSFAKCLLLPLEQTSASRPDHEWAGVFRCGNFDAKWE